MTTYTYTASRDALIAIIDSAMPDGVHVARGAFGIYLAPEQVLFAPTMQADYARANLGQPRRFDETYQAAVRIRTWSGDDDVSAREDRIWELFELFTAPINSDPTLGGVVLDCWVAAAQLVNAGPTEGGGSAAEFDVVIQIENQTV